MRRAARAAGILPRGVAMAAAVTAGAVAMTAGPAAAGGYDTGERDWEFLFSEAGVATEAGVRYLAPRRTLTGITGTLGPSLNAREAEAFAVPRGSLAVRLGENFRCMASYREPWGGHANYGTAWTYTASAVEQHFSSRDYGLTCAGGAKVGMGRLSVVGGISVQEASYELIQGFGPGITAVTDVSDRGVAWRAGFAYEIPEYALRASLIYDSAVDYDMTGTFTAFGAALPVFGAITMPQSVTLSAQSGVAPGWLAFGRVKWTDWSVADNMPLCPVGVPACTQAAAVSGLTLLFKDTWTVTLGAAHQLSEMVAVAGSLTYDQGATQGFTSQTDTWVAGLEAVISPSDNVRLSFGGSLGLMTGGTLSTMVLPGGIPNPVGYTASFGDDLLWSLGGKAVVTF